MDRLPFAKFRCRLDVSAVKDRLDFARDHLGVARRGVELGMSEQDLDHTNVDVLLEQVRGEAVSERVRRHPIGVAQPFGV